MTEELPDIITLTSKEKFNIAAPLPYQRLVINSTLIGNGYFGEELQAEEPKRRIIILPTGAGKTLCFMLPYFLIEGITLVVFPLLSLIGDQYRRCKEAGIDAAVLKGGMTKEERANLFKEMKKWERGILLCNMEILLAPGILEQFDSIPISNLVFDEAHTLFEWGDTFRPSLQQGYKVIEELKPKLVNAFTATASQMGIERIKELLFPECERESNPPVVINANPDRPNISYHLLPSLSPKRSLVALFSNSSRDGLDPTLPTLERPAILFFRNRRSTERVAAYLRRQLTNIPVYHYHAGLSKEEKSFIEETFFNSSNAILCSTNAYGMGVDKSNIRTVIHMQFPPTLESYLQESGRAGRDRGPSSAWLLVRPDYSLTKEIHPAIKNFISNNELCRREALMKHMGRDDVFCSGCDVCDKTVIERTPNEEKLFQTLKYLSRDLNNRKIKKTIRKSSTKYFPQLLPFKKWNEAQLDELLESVQTELTLANLKNKKIF